MEKRKVSLQNKWLDGLLDGADYKRLSSEIVSELSELEQEISDINAELGEHTDDYGIKMATIHKVEAELLGGENYSEINYENEEMFKAIVAQVRVMPDHCFRWYLNIGSGRGWSFFSEEAYELYDYFTISFDEARRFRKRNNQWLRECQYNPIKVEVFIRTK